MRLLPSDPDIQTLVQRIREHQIDLQPDFQRGVVWSDVKCQRLIDSILRDWHVPPIHLVRDAAEHEVVLDGQQRLVAIRRFADGDIRVDGSTEPADPEIQGLDGLTYSRLPPKFRRRFDRFAIRVFTIVDYAPEEPYELFYRLNEPSVLTSSEKRNAFFGPARQQVKELVEFAISRGMVPSRIGFSNSRMAYDDVLSKLCLTLEQGTLRAKTTAAAVTEKYRSKTPFDNHAYLRAKYVLDHFLTLEALDEPLKFNKATLFSWLCFVAAALRHDVAMHNPERVGTFVRYFELSRAALKTSLNWFPASQQPIERNAEELLRLFNDRASARVADVASIIIRDAVLWLVYSRFVQLPVGTKHHRLSERFESLAGSLKDGETFFLRELDELDWGHPL